MPTKLSEAASPKFSHHKRKHFCNHLIYEKKKRKSGNSYIVQEFTGLISVIYVEKYKETSFSEIFKPPPVKPTVQAGNVTYITSIPENCKAA